MLWPDSDRADTWLMEALSRVRRSLGPHHGRIVRCPDATLCFNADGAHVDLAAFDRAVRAGSPEDLARATALYTGPLLDGFSDEWAVAARSQREEEYLQAVESLTAHYLRNDRSHEAILLLLSATAVDPLRTSLHGLLMEAYAANHDHPAALRLYGALRRRLMAENLPVPADLAGLARAIQADARRQSRDRASVARTRTSAEVPATLTPLVGRETEVAALCEAVSLHRLVTLTGMGGVGKTRLAIAIAERLAGEGIVRPMLIRLDGVPREGDVARTVCAALGLGDRGGGHRMEAMALRLRASGALLILDNCEHVLRSCSNVVVELIGRCPALHILCTSRRSLGIPGEIVRSVPPLACPDVSPRDDVGTGACDASTDAPAVRLFIERAKAADERFRPTPEHRGTIAQICRTLGGLPLGIELAAARLRNVSLAALARLGASAAQPLAGLPERQQTLDACIAWSCDLLSPGEREVLEAISVFVGGFDAESVAAVVSVPANAVQSALSSLADHSLITAAGPDGATRYRMHEVIRQYALSRLDPARLDDLRSRHLRRFVAYASIADGHQHTESESLWTDALAQDHDNLRAACAFALADPSRLDECLDLGAALESFWDIRGYTSEGREYYAAAVRIAEAYGTAAQIARAHLGAGRMAIAEGDGRGSEHFDRCCALLRPDGPSVTLIDALLSAARIAEAQRQFGECKSYAEEALGLSRMLDEPLRAAEALGLLARRGLSDRSYSEAARHARSAIAIQRELGERVREARTTATLGLIEMRRGRRDAGLALVDRGLLMLRQGGARRALAIWLNIRGDLARKSGAYELAIRLHEEGLAMFRADHNLRGAAWALVNLGQCAMEQGHLEDARPLLCEALRMRADLHDLKGMAEALETLARLALATAIADASEARCHARRAARLLGVADAVRQMIRTPPDATLRRAQRLELRDVRRLIGLRAARHEWHAGLEMPLEAAIADALSA